MNMLRIIYDQQLTAIKRCVVVQNQRNDKLPKDVTI